MIPSSRIKHFHFIGIGGAGMSGIAEVLHENDFQVSGSDMNNSDIISYLTNKGIKISIGHHPENVSNADVVVYSSAVQPDNVEYQEAKERNIPVVRRAEMLGELMRLKYTIAVAGTHGKTTTTSLLGSIWNYAQLDPTIIVGGVVKNLGSGAQVGKGDALIAEADEYDKSFLEMIPSLALITNVDEDHLDCYEDLDDIKNAFIHFANTVPFYGLVAVCVDEEGVRDIIPQIKKPLITYGFSKQANYRAKAVEFSATTSTFEVIAHGKSMGTVNLSIPGEHNIKNALGAITLAMEEGISFDVIKEALADFKGVRRRFEYVNTHNGGLIYDDYAHHPREVESTLLAARKHFPDKYLVAIFQPHLYSRTQDQYKNFASAFMECDELVLTPIYGAREKPVEGVDSNLIAQATKKLGHKNVRLIDTFDQISDYVRDHIDENTLVLTLGAGNVWKIAEGLKDL